MPPYAGYGSYIGVGEESPYGAAASRDRWFAIRSCSLQDKTTWVKRNEIPIGGRVASKKAKTRRGVSGNITMLLRYEGMGRLLKQILWGTPSSTTGSAPYTHTYTTGTTQPASMTIEVNRGDSGYTDVFLGCVISQATFRFAAGEQATLDLSILGRSGSRSSATPSPTFNSADAVVEHYEAGSISWNSQTLTVNSMELTVDEKLAERLVLGDVSTALPKPTDSADIKIKLDLEWADNTLIDGFVAGTDSDFTVTFTNADSKTFAITAENCHVEDASDPIQNAGVIKQTVTLMAKKDASGGYGGLRLVLGGSSASSAEAA